ncbi:hypothetical protein [Paenibacillus silagei]|uniref:Uncharacterized protein n=1 Tax=Paenibacillus silagei TaxID=1670801 RepID=A0ABS4NVJ8_9BACL|nr:hypothetical protein [Paenibacillus silagei]MBP2114088.1 hypothetical protein [Paenibacillus silagei]
MQLTTKQLDKMNAYVGCGPHLDADILILGNEEGTDGFPEEIAAHAAARFRLYGKDQETVSTLLDSMTSDRDILYQDDLYPSEYHKYSPKGLWTNGFWEPSANAGGEKIKEYLKRYYGSIPTKSTDRLSAFNTHTARICLTIKAIKTDSNFPIETYLNYDKSKRNEIVAFTEEQLYTPNPWGGVATALMDWRPLPRPNEGGWPPEYQALFKNADEYLDAYLFKKNATPKMQAFVERRIQYLKTIILQSRANHLITIGQTENKLDIIARMFPKQKLEIEKMPLKNRAYYVRVRLPEKTLNIYVLPFFNYFSIENLYRVAKHYIIPNYFDFPHLSEKSNFASITYDHKIKNEKTSKKSKSIRVESLNGSEEKLFLLELAQKISDLEPDIRHTSARRDNKVNYNYMHMWFDDSCWGTPQCSAHIHVNFQSIMKVEIRWGVHPDKFEEPIRSNLIKAANYIGNMISEYGFQRSSSSRKLIIFHKILQKDKEKKEELLNDAVMELRRMLSLARENIIKIVPD